MNQSAVPETFAVPVPLHRQNVDTYCGAACIQMLRAAYGEPAVGISQGGLFSDAESGAGLPACANTVCGTGKCKDDTVAALTPTPANGHWETCPGGLLRSLQAVPGLKDKYDLSRALTVGDMVQRIVFSLQSNVPCVALVDSGNHWLVIYGARRLEGSEWYFEIRDPWPPLESNMPHNHDHGSCSTFYKSAVEHLMFPGGMLYRFRPAQQGAFWRNTNVLIGAAPSGALDIPEEKVVPVLRGELPANALDLARAAAVNGFVQTQALQWPPSLNKTVTTGNTLEMKIEFWCRQLNCLKGRECVLVELIDTALAEGETSVLAIALVTLSLDECEVLEIQVPAGGKSWVPKPAETRQRIREAILHRRNARKNQPELVSDGLEWLDASEDRLKAEYYWRSCPQSRSPFHPLLKLLTESDTAWLSPDNILSTKL